MEETDQKLSESESEEFSVDDDSEEDPTFDITDDTRSSLSRLSLKKKKKKTKSRISDDDEEPDDVPELNAKDTKSYENVEKIIADGQLEKLKVEQCKVYLRKNGLRLTGKKGLLIERITEHLGIINGGGEHKYPVSSFVYNCKGDACTGDVVMFEQNVYEMYNIASRSATGPPCGTRTLAGRIVKESYGSAKQQHTFTIEVLWSKGEKPLPPLHPLLIKGRNLYKLKTMRQLWADEEMRRKVLLEKHSRGSLARSNRETRIKQKEMRKKSTTQRVLTNERNTVQEKERRMSPDELGMNNFLPLTAQLQNQLPAICTKQPTQFGQHKPAFPPKMVLTEVCMNTMKSSSITEHGNNKVDNGYQVSNHSQNQMSEKVNQSYNAYANANKLQHNGIKEAESSQSSGSQNHFSEKLHQSHHANANQSSFNAPPRNSIPGRAPSQRKIEPILSGNLPPGFDSSTCRSVYVGNIHIQVTKPLLQEVFASTGPLEGCKLIRKEKSSYGFVDYCDRRSAELAILSLNGRHLSGQPIKVNWAYANCQREDTLGKWIRSRQIRCNWATKDAGVNGDKHNSDAKSMAEFSNRTSYDGQELKKEDAPENKLNNPQYTTIYVGNLAPEVTRLDLHCFFYALGAGVLEEVRVQRGKRFGFVRYSTHAEAALGIQMGSANILFGKAIKCSWGSKPTPPGKRSAPLPPPA